MNKLKYDINGSSFNSLIALVLIIIFAFGIASFYIPEIKEIYRPTDNDISVKWYMRNLLTNEKFQVFSSALVIDYDEGDNWVLILESNVPYSFISEAYTTTIHLLQYVGSQYETLWIQNTEIPYTAIYSNTFNYDLSLPYGEIYIILLYVNSPYQVGVFPVYSVNFNVGVPL